MKPLPIAGTLTDDGVLRSLVVFYVLSCIHVHTQSPKLWPIESKPLLPSQKLIYICKFHCLQAPLESLGAQLFSRRACTRGFHFGEGRSLFFRGLRSKIPQLGIIVSEASHGAFSLDKLCPGFDRRLRMQPILRYVIYSFILKLCRRARAFVRRSGQTDGL